MSTLNANAYKGQCGDSLFSTPNPRVDVLFSVVIFKRLQQNCILITVLCDHDYEYADDSQKVEWRGKKTTEIY